MTGSSAGITKAASGHFFVNETRRIVTPDKTVERFMKLAPAMGITRLANITGLDTIGIPVYTAHRPNARSLSVAQGKGYTRDAARASALMESIESYHAETIDLPLRLASYAELACGRNVVDVSALPKPHDHVFTAHARILWIEGEDLLSGGKKFVPYEMVHLDYRDPLPAGHGCFIPSSNGLASGNHLLEAMIHGICEVLETDALEAFEQQPPATQRLQKLDLGSITDARCADILRRLAAAQVHVGLWGITGVTGVPAFLCRILPETASDISGLRPASGLGCHLSRDVALLRALTEAAQSRLTFISGLRDDLSREGYSHFLSSAEHAAWRDCILDAPPAPKDARLIESFETPVLEQDMEALLLRLKKAGVKEVVSVDLTKPDFGVPVVRIIIPGLRGACE